MTCFLFVFPHMIRFQTVMINSCHSYQWNCQLRLECQCELQPLGVLNSKMFGFTREMRNAKYEMPCGEALFNSSPLDRASRCPSDRGTIVVNSIRASLPFDDHSDRKIAPSACPSFRSTFPIRASPIWPNEMNDSRLLSFSLVGLSL
jgi:hypothetical protein